MHTTLHPYKTSSTPFNLKTKIINRNHTLNFWSSISLNKRLWHGTDQWGRHELANHFHVVSAYEDGLAPIPASVVSSSYATKVLKSKTKVTTLIYLSDIYYAGVIPRKEGKAAEPTLVEIIDLMDWNTSDTEVANIMFIVCIFKEVTLKIKLINDPEMSEFAYLSVKLMLKCKWLHSLKKWKS